MAAGVPVRALLVGIVGPEQQQREEMIFTLIRQHINKPTMTFKFRDTYLYPNSKPNEFVPAGLISITHDKLCDVMLSDYFVPCHILYMILRTRTGDETHRVIICAALIRTDEVTIGVMILWMDNT